MCFMTFDVRVFKFSRHMRLVCIRWIHKHSSCPLRSTITIPRCPHLPPQIWKHIQSHKSCCFWRCCTKHEAATNSHITALSQRWAMALSNLDWSLGACRLASVWSAGDLRAAPYFPLSSRMAIHGAVRRDYSDGVLHPPAIFRGYEWWRLISQWARSLSLSCPSVWSLTSSVSHYVSLSLSLSTDREDQSILCTWVKTDSTWPFSITDTYHQFVTQTFNWTSSPHFQLHLFRPEQLCMTQSSK